MAAIFQGTCKHCGYQSAADADTALAVLISQDHVALGEPLNKLLVSYDVGNLVSAEHLCLIQLAHPLKDSILKSAGLTMRDASSNGQLVRLQSVVCRECGTTFRRRRLIACGLGCFSTLAICLIVGFAAGYSRGSIAIGFIAAYGAIFVIAAADPVIQWWKLRAFRERAYALTGAGNCPNCGSDSIQSVCKSTSVTCPSCRQRSMVFKMSGIS